MALTDVKTEYVEMPVDHDSEKGYLLDLLAEGKPYIFLTVQGTEDGVAVVSLDHNAPEGHTDAIRYVLELSLKALPQ
jgi:hypothetical protein